MKKWGGWWLALGALWGCAVPDVNEFQAERIQNCGQTFTCPEGTQCQDGSCVAFDESGGSCTPACAALDICVATTHRCVSRFSKLTVLDPKDGAVLPLLANANTTVNITAELQQVAASSAVDFPKELRFSLLYGGQTYSVSQVRHDGGRYYASFLASSQGSYSVVVNLDDVGLSDKVSFDMKKP